MNKTCDTCKHVNVRQEDYPCCVCTTHRYPDRWEKAAFDDLINDIQGNDWYCIRNGSEDNLYEWEK